jgi:DNA-binding response OmpR family regulator
LSISETPKILVVDDEQSMREFLDIMLAKEGYRVCLRQGRRGSHWDSRTGLL